MAELFENLGINGKLLFAQAVNFLLVLWLLNRFVFKKLIIHLEERKGRIERGIALSEKAKREMERIEEARKRELEKARQEAESFLQKARASAQQKEREALSLTKQRVESILLQAKQDAQRSKQDAMKEARGEIVKTALLFAEKVLARTFAKEDEEGMIKEALEQLEKQYAK